MWTQWTLCTVHRLLWRTRWERWFWALSEPSLKTSWSQTKDRFHLILKIWERLSTGLITYPKQSEPQSVPHRDTTNRVSVGHCRAQLERRAPDPVCSLVWHWPHTGSDVVFIAAKKRFFFQFTTLGAQHSEPSLQTRFQCLSDQTSMWAHYQWVGLCLRTFCCLSCT